MAPPNFPTKYDLFAGEPDTRLAATAAFAYHRIYNAILFYLNQRDTQDGIKLQRWRVGLSIEVVSPPLIFRRPNSSSSVGGVESRSRRFDRCGL